MAVPAQLAKNKDLRGHRTFGSKLIGNAPGGQVIMRAQGSISLADTTISVATVGTFQIDRIGQAANLSATKGSAGLISSRMMSRSKTAPSGRRNVSDIGSPALSQGAQRREFKLSRQFIHCR